MIMDIKEIINVELLFERKKRKKKKKKAKRDACYYKVKSRYDVWPSAYASGALSKCRKVGADNWGNSSNESEESFNIEELITEKRKLTSKPSSETKSKPVNENVSEISRIVNQYMKDTEYDIQNSLGNCSFFTRDVINWAKNNGVKADYVYMPMSEEYRKTNNISDNEWEDHIVPMINNVIIDFAYTPQGVSKNVRTSNTIPPKVFKYSDNLFKPNGIYGKFGYTKPEINTEYGNPKDINSFDVVEPNKKKEKLGELFIYESIDKIAGVWDTNEKFDDGSDFKIKFKVSDIIELAKDLPVKNIDPKKIEYDFSGRQEDPTKTKDRVNNADLSYPIIVVKNENGKIFAMLDGTHRLEKALKLGLDKIKTKILNKQDLIQFKTDSLNEAKKTDYSKEKEEGLHGWFARQGEKGKSQGWVDCNTCRKDPETGRKKCKSCGREEGEKRAKYPACRPTPSACGTKGKGKKWGKKTKSMKEDYIINGKLITEGKELISESVLYHFENRPTLTENIYRYGSEGYFKLINEVRSLYNKGIIDLSPVDEELVHTDIGKRGIYENKVVWLDVLYEAEDETEVINEAEYQGKKVQLGKPKRGGSKKFYVYTKCGDKVKKVSFGAKSGGGKLAVKLKDPKARKAFSDRHNCPQKNDKCSAGYWACRLPRYAKSLGLSGGGTWW